MSRPGAIHTKVCKLSGLKGHNYALGEIISIPFHQSNTNPNVDECDERLTINKKHGAIYSKRRMVVVLWIDQEILFCVPLYTWNKRGISSKPDNLRPEYAALKNVGDTNFHNQSIYEPIEARSRKAFEPTCTIHLTGAIPVRCEEDIARCGRVTEESFEYLCNIWKGVSTSAQKQHY